MSHKTFKVSIIIDDSVENFYIKHYVDDFQPIFNKFKSLVFQRNPSVNSPILKIYWIDAENDKILISCEEDFRMYIEQGQGKKIFFSVIKESPQEQQDEEEVAMEAEESNGRCKSERRSRKSTRDEERQKRASKRLAEKMRSAEEKIRVEAERHSRCSEKHERKNIERLERAKRRCDQIRQLIGSSLGSFDPANLSTDHDTTTSAGPSMSTHEATIPSAVHSSNDAFDPSPEIIRYVSNAIIAGCLHPANLINKLLTEIIGMVPAVPENTTQASAGANEDQQQQQQAEVLKQNTATNTSDMNTPVAAHPSNEEIRALFKEAAKELEKMNEIANSSKTMESSTISGTSSSSAATQIERVMKSLTDSTISNATIVNIDQADTVEARAKSPQIEESFKIVTPTKSLMRSRDSSIEVHDVNSMMSDESRDWTMLDADHSASDHEDESSPLVNLTVDSFTVDVSVADPDVSIIDPNASILSNNDSFKSISTETQTAMASGDNAALLSQEEIRASIQKSIETVGEMSAMVANAVATAQKSLADVQPAKETTPLLAPKPTPSAQIIDSEKTANSIASQASPVANSVAAQATPVAKSVASQATPVTETPSAPPAYAPPTYTPPTSAPPSAAPRQAWPSVFSQASTQANLMANRMSSGTKRKAPQVVGPAVIVYDPNPKINAAVHTMLAMGYSNDGGWLTQLLLNVGGDVPSAINFLAPQPKNKPE